MFKEQWKAHEAEIEKTKGKGGEIREVKERGQIMCSPLNHVWPPYSEEIESTWRVLDREMP